MKFRIDSDTGSALRGIGRNLSIGCLLIMLSVQTTWSQERVGLDIAERDWSSNQELSVRRNSDCPLLVSSEGSQRSMKNLASVDIPIADFQENQFVSIRAEIEINPSLMLDQLNVITFSLDSQNQQVSDKQKFQFHPGNTPYSGVIDMEPLNIDPSSIFHRFRLRYKGENSNEIEVCIRRFEIVFQSSDNSGLEYRALDRPRLFFDAAKLERVRAASIQNEQITDWLFNQADNFARLNTSELVNQSGEGKVRKAGLILPHLVFASLLSSVESDVSRYREAALKIADSIVEQENWGKNIEIGAAERLIGLSVVYDWMQDELAQSRSDAYRDKIVTQAGYLHDTLINHGKRWSKAYLQNHNYTNTLAIAVAGVVLLGEVDDASNWLDSSIRNFDRVLGLLSPDGASHEGVGYWSGGLFSLVRYFLLMEPFTGTAALKNNHFLQNTAKYRLHSSVPGFQEIVDFSDSPRYDYKGPAMQLNYLARLFDDAQAAQLASKVNQARGESVNRSWLDILVAVDSDKSNQVFDPVTYSWFDNMGFLFSRSDWSDEAFWAAYKTGPSQGFHAQAKDVYVGSHVHPDAGHFVLYDRGEWLVVDDGYVFKKRTSNHNTLVINGYGQIGEGEKWFDRQAAQEHHPRVEILHVELTDNYQYIVSELAGLYPDASKLKSWIRSFLVIKGSNIVIHDSVKTDGESSQLINRFHLPIEPRIVGEKFDYCIGSEGQLSLKVFPGKGSSIDLGEYSIPKNERKTHGQYDGWELKHKEIFEDQIQFLQWFHRNPEECGPVANVAEFTEERLIVDADNYKFNVDFNLRTVKFESVAK